MTFVPCLRALPQVTLLPSPGGFRILAVLDAAARVLGHDLLLTAGTNDHSGDDPHVRGDAYDVRVKDFDTAQVLKLFNYLQSALGHYFTVLYETPVSPTDTRLQGIAFVNVHASAVHLHIQVRQGEVYPPIDPLSGLVA